MTPTQTIGPVEEVSYSHILGETFHSMAALRFGELVVKITQPHFPSRSDHSKGPGSG